MTKEAPPPAKPTNTIMDKSSELECYLYFMWNAWSYDLCAKIFADTCYERLWYWWKRKVDEIGATGAAASWYLVLDGGNRRRIRKAAVSYYNKEG